MELCNLDKFTDFFTDIFYDEIKSWDQDSQCEAEALGYMDKGGYLKDVAREYASRTCEDFEELCHRKDTSMIGNFADIRRNYQQVIKNEWSGPITFKFERSEVADENHSVIRKKGLTFDEAVKYVKSAGHWNEPDDFIKDWWDFLLQWYVYAFGTRNICYDFATQVGEEISYENENQLEEE